MKNFILILCLATFSQWVYAQNKQISGRVVDTKGEAAIGASILEKGTTNGNSCSQQDETEYHHGGRHGSAG